jgi:1-acyl-sn-glycerol-3-phosphate acyltransferase
MLKKSNRSLVMFPSGSRHSSELKGGVAVIAKSAKVKLMPATYVGPMSINGLLAGERIDVAFGNPIDVSDIKRLDDAGTAEVTHRIETEFKRLNDYARSFQTQEKPNILTYIYRLPILILVAIILGLTYVFSYIASFFWNPSVELKNELKNSFLRVFLFLFSNKRMEVNLWKKC